MRDRLEILIDTFFATVDIDKFYSQNQKEKLVKWLRENGVIVPPCKVGDTVYVIGSQTERIIPLAISGMWTNGETTTVITTQGMLSSKFYLTPEEAEKALKERQSDNS